MAAYREDGAATRRELEALLRRVEREAMVADRQLARWGPAPAPACHTAPKEAVSAAWIRSPHAALEVTASGTEILHPRTTPEKPAAGVPLIPCPCAARRLVVGAAPGTSAVTTARAPVSTLPVPGTQVGRETSGPCPCTQVGGEASVPCPCTQAGGEASVPCPCTQAGGEASVPCPCTQVGGEASVPCPCTQVGGEASVPCPCTQAGREASVPCPCTQADGAASVPCSPCSCVGGENSPHSVSLIGLGPVARAPGQRHPPARPLERLSGWAGFLSWSVRGGSRSGRIAPWPEIDDGDMWR